MQIRFRVAADDEEWLRMRLALWPEDGAAGRRAGMREWVARPDACVIVAARPEGRGLAGFAEVERAVRYRKPL